MAARFRWICYEPLACCIRAQIVRCVYAAPSYSTARRSRGFWERWADPKNRVWLAALIGDWPAAHEAALACDMGDLALITGYRAEECRRDWLKRLREWAEQVDMFDNLLWALTGNPIPSDATKPRTEIDLACATLDAIADDPSYCPQVFELMLESTEGHYLYHADATVAYFARHNYRSDDIVKHLRRFCGFAYEKIVELALQLGDSRLMSLLRSGLSSEMFDRRLVAAAVLALADEEWSRAELISVLNRSHTCPQARPARNCSSM